jgi:putative addiction module component (TIGR02574 family)
VYEAVPDAEGDAAAAKLSRSLANLHYDFAMTAKEIQQGALDLPEDERASLISELIGSLPAVLADFDDGSTEARRRIAELKRDPSAGRSWDQIKAELGR